MMMQPIFAGSPGTARSIGLGDRFRYWLGASGRRYLFSMVAMDALDDLHNVVVIEASVQPGEAEPQPIWLGEVDGVGAVNGYALGAAAGRMTRTFVHFLAGSDIERHATMLDLAGGQA